MLFRLLICFYFMKSYGSHGKSYDEVKAWFIEQGVECVQEHPIVPSDMLLLEQHKMPESQNGKCWLACVFKKANMVDSKGMFDVASSLALTENHHSDDPSKQEQAKQLMNICKKVNDETVSDGEKGCERSTLLFKCFIDNAPQLGLALS